MKILFFILICVVCAVVFFLLGRLIGYVIAKKQAKRDEVLRNGSKHI